LRRPHPVVPERTALAAAIEQKTHGDHAGKYCHTPEHERPPFEGRSYDQAAHFQAAARLFPLLSWLVSVAFSSREPAIPAANAGQAPLQDAMVEPVKTRRGNMQQQQAAELDIREARRVLGEVFAPWVQDLNLSVEAFDFDPPPGASGWQPGAVLRLPFSERLCRNGGVVCGQALMAFADTAMVIANLAANRGYRMMTTVDQTTHFMRAVAASDVLADARVVRLGRTMSFGRVTLSSAADGKPVAMVSSAFAML
jgi:uncharacterized protein (TIGR00369 family)